ncbi:hypothetical protein [Helicobacter pylori]|uniref:hypothetical protein n=1 Tax=Helicobacter pylori TaxID=210 RepID=UPI001ABBABA9|nr:hypothetical protein [Helicobacter pylori]
MGSFFPLGKSSNDTQENPKDAQKSTNFQEKHTKPTETTELTDKNQKLTAEKENLTKEKIELTEKNKVLTTEKDNLTKDKTDLTNKNTELQKQVKDLQDSKQVLENEKAELSKEKENLTKDKTELTEKNKALTTEKDNLAKANTKLTDKNKALTTEKDNLTKDKENLTAALSAAKTQAEQTSQKLNELEQRHAPYQKLEKLYEVFLEVRECLNFNFVATTQSAMDLIASVLSDSKYYLESLYNKASQELSDKRSDKGEKLAELFDLLFEYIKDSKFERLKEPSAYDYSCKTLYLEQNTSQKMQRVVLRGYKHNDKVYYTIVDMGS